MTEAKYIDAASLGAKRKESQKQLRDTMRRFRDALFGSQERLDRELWLSRLSDLLLDGIQFPSNAPIDLVRWRRAVREGTCDIYIRGYSHIFVSSSSDGDITPDFVTVADTTDCYQEIFGRTQVRDLVIRYLHNQNPGAIRESSTDDSIRLEPTYTPAAPTGPAIVAEQRTEELWTQDELAALEHSLSHGKPESSTQSLPSSPSLPSTVGPPETDATTETPWVYPHIGTLIRLGRTMGAVSPDANEWLKQVAQQTKGALQQFQLRSKLVRSVLTPNAALLKFEGSANLTVDQVLKRRSEFLTTFGLNLISVQPEPGIVSLAIERPQRQLVLLQDLWQRCRRPAAPCSSPRVPAFA